MLTGVSEDILTGAGGLFFEILLRIQAHRYPIWARSTYFKPGPVDGRAWTLWQYTDRASVPGAPGRVDQNVFAGGEEEFARFLGTKP